MRTFAYIFALALLIVPVSASAQVSIEPSSARMNEVVFVTNTESETLIFKESVYYEAHSEGSFGFMVQDNIDEYRFVNFSASAFDFWTQEQSDACMEFTTATYESCLTALDNISVAYSLATLTVIPPVLGCMDPEANNYNPSADTEDYSCTYTEAGIGFIVSSASTGFSDTTGFSFSDSVSWMGGILLTFVGVALATLWEMKYWIVAIIAIGAVVFFVFKGLRFFNTTGSLPSKKGVTVKK